MAYITATDLKNYMKINGNSDDTQLALFADRAQYWQGVAVGGPAENGRGGYMRTAMNIDGQGTPTRVIEDFSLIAVRN